MTKNKVLKAAQLKRYYWRRRARGVCVRCGKPAAPFALCDRHISADSMRKRKDYRERVAAAVSDGLCRCGNAPMTGRDVCWCCDQRAKRAA